MSKCNEKNKYVKARDTFVRMSAKCCVGSSMTKWMTLQCVQIVTSCRKKEGHIPRLTSRLRTDIIPSSHRSTPQTRSSRMIVSASVERIFKSTDHAI